MGANNDMVGATTFPLLSREHWHLLVRLPDLPSKKDLRHLPRTVLIALLQANGICRLDGCTQKDAWTTLTN